MKNENFCSTLASLLTSLRSCRALWLLVFIAALATKAQAQFELTVGGSSSHMYNTSIDDIQHPYLKSGKISFDAVNGVVTLDNVVFENPAGGVDGRCIDFSYPGTNGRKGKLVLKGTNKITSKGDKPILLTMLDCTIVREVGAGYTAENCVLEVNCTSSTAYGICLNKSSLYVSNCTVKVHGGYYGIGGWGYDITQAMGTTGAFIYAQGSKGSIANISSLNLGGGDQIRRPTGAAFDSALNGVALNGSLVTDEVFICNKNYEEPGDKTPPVPGEMSVIPYASSGIAYVNWTPAVDDVTAQGDLEYSLRYKMQKDLDWTTYYYQKNIKNFILEGLEQGTAYDIELRVRDEAGNIASYAMNSFRVGQYYGLWVEGEEVTDENASYIRLTKGYASYDLATKTLTVNNANLVGYGNETYGIWNSDVNGLTIKFIGTNHITTDDFGIKIDKDTYLTGDGSLSIESEYMLPVGGDNGAELGFLSCYIDTPLFAEYDRATGRILSWGGNEVRTRVYINSGVAYNLCFSDRVTDKNKNNITPLGLTKGKASYDPTTKTLTLDNVDFTPEVYYDLGIMNNVEGLTVKLVGENKINCDAGEGVWLLKSATFTGDGNLKVSSKDADAVAINKDGVTLTIKNTNVSLYSEFQSAISGTRDGKNQKVSVEYSYMALSCWGQEGIVENIDVLEMKDCDFENDDFYFNSSVRGICDRNLGGDLAGQNDIIIMPSEPSEDVPYVVFTSSDKTLTFYYDKKIKTRSGTVMDFELTGIGGSYWHNWNISDMQNHVVHVVFDPSFSKYQPTEMSGWFEKFGALKDLTGMENLNTSKVTTMNKLFSECHSLQEVDLTHFNMSACENTRTMFSGCTRLTTIYCNGDWSKLSKLNNAYNMFVNCTLLKGEKGTAYNTSYLDASWARPDGGSDAPGYFTRKQIKGDVNGDGAVNVADIAAIIDVMAGNASYDSADVNEDKSVNVADIAAVIDIMAGK